jgi:hypothetical protein
MLTFKKIENSRTDFGNYFQYSLEKNWLYDFFDDENVVTECWELIKNFCEINELENQEWHLKNLFNNSQFLESENCTELLTLFSSHLFELPMEFLEWEKHEKSIGNNFIWTEILETDYLPNYYIIHKSSEFDLSNLPKLFLLNKETGRQLSFGLDAILPSDQNNILYGKFRISEIDSSEFFRLTFKLDETEKDIIEKDFQVQNLKNLIQIPNEILSSAVINFESPIMLHETNVPYKTIQLTDPEDIKFRNRLVELRKDYLPF